MHVQGSVVCTAVNGMYVGQWYVRGYVRGLTVCADERFLYCSTRSYRKIRIIGTHTK